MLFGNTGKGECLSQTNHNHEKTIRAKADEDTAYITPALMPGLDESTDEEL